MATVESVTIDTREPDEFQPLFEEDEDVDRVSVQQMPVGDFLTRPSVSDEEAVVFERKTASDYVSSIKNRRLETQIEKMQDEFGPTRSFLLVEGDMQDFDYMPYTNFSSPAVRGFTASISARWQTIPLFCSDKVKLADMVVRISRKLEEAPSHTVRKPENTPDSADADFHEKALLQIEGVGDDLASKLMEEYTNPLYNLSIADPEDIEHIDGIGESTASKIIKQVRGEY